MVVASNNSGWQYNNLKYKLDDEDVGQLFGVQFSFWDGINNQEFNFNPTPIIRNVNDLPYGSISISGHQIEDPHLKLI